MALVNGTTILVSGDDSYEIEVTEIIRKIAASVTGQAVIFKIRSEGFLAVSLYTKGDFNADTDVATEGMILSRLAHIHFSPSTFDAVTVVNGFVFPNVKAILLPGQQPAPTLLHEMVHAGRILGRDFKMLPLTGKMAPYDNEEDFFAILVANIFMSELGKPYYGLRSSHHLYGPSLQRWESVSEIFLFENDNFRLIEKFCKQHTKMAPMIARSQAAFNPIRSYYMFTGDSGPVADPVPIIDLKTHDDTSTGYKVTQQERLPPLTDDYLISILKPRYNANDVAGYGGRVRKLQQIFRTAGQIQALPLFTRLTLRPPGDRVAMYFHDHLSTATRKTLLQTLVNGR
jgi:hypothetical protein